MVPQSLNSCDFRVGKKWGLALFTAISRNLIIDLMTGSPRNVELTATGFDSLEFTWDPPSMDSTVAQYLVLFEDQTYSVEPTATLSLALDSLDPHTAYNCCVVANTTSGASSFVCVTQKTLETGMQLLF